MDKVLGTHRHVHELFRSPDPAAQWVDNDLTAFAAGAPAAVGIMALDGYAQEDGSQHVNFVDGRFHVHELFRSPDPAAQWVDNDLTAFAAGAPASVDRPLDGYAQGDNSQHVNFVDGRFHVHELFRSPDPAAQWVDNDLTAFAAGAPAFAGKNDGYAEGDGSQHVNFVAETAGGKFHVHELFRSPDPAAQWVDNDLIALSGGTPAAAASSLDGYAQGDDSQHVNFVDVNGHVHELYNQ